MKKPYEGHEFVYRRMKKKGIRSWNENQRMKAVDKGTKRFLADALAQPLLVPTYIAAIPVDPSNGTQGNTQWTMAKAKAAPRAAKTPIIPV